MLNNDWTREEDEILINSRLHRSMSYAKISDMLSNRTVNSVRHRWEKIRSRINLEEVLVGRKSPKILIYDIETSPMLIYTWGIYQQYIRPENVAQDWFVISWAAKWINKSKMMSGVLTSKESLNRDDKRIVSELWKLFDEADIIVAHNGDRFDQKKMNWRFLYHGFPPPLSYKSVDTLKVARKYFRATSNSLDYLTGELGVGRKTETGGLNLWVECMNGNKSALSEMVRYNKNDVIILEDVYQIMLPWITNHPNLGLFSDKEVYMCPNCGSEDISFSDKLSSTAINAYYQYRCNNCSHVGRTKAHATTLEKRKMLVSN